MKKKTPLILMGNTAFAEVAYEYFTHDSGYEVVAFSVEKPYLKKTALLGLPVVPFESVEKSCAPRTHRFFVAITYAQSNHLRTRFYLQAKEKGYTPASYVSSRAFVWRNAQLGEHCFIFENNVIQPFSKVGNNCILWSGNHVGHHSLIQDHCFISSHVVIAGFSKIGEYCFMGINAAMSNNLTIGKRCTIGAGALVLDNVGENKTVTGVWRKKDNARAIP